MKRGAARRRKKKGGPTRQPPPKRRVQVKMRSWRLAPLGVLAVAAAAPAAGLAATSGAARPTEASGPAKGKVAVLLSVGLKDTGYGRSALSGINQVKAQLGNQVDTADLIKPADF